MLSAFNVQMPSAFKVKSGYVLYVSIVVNSIRYNFKTQVILIHDFQNRNQNSLFPIIKRADKIIPNSAT